MDGNGSITRLIERCTRGERRAWDEFYARYRGLVSCAVRKYGAKGMGDDEDAIQEVFMHLFRALRHYDPSRSLEAYVLEIARRVQISRYRKDSATKRGGKGKTLIPIDAHDGDERGYISVAAPDDNQETTLIKAQESRLLRMALRSLSEACQKLLAMRYDQGLPYKEMASTLKEKEGTLRVRVQRCMTALGRTYSDLALEGVDTT